jgi:protein-S-isoprenylcysteine O-methyltransferase Ste14
MFHWPLTAGVSPLAQPLIVLGALTLFFQWQHEKMEHFSDWKIHWQAVATALALAAIVSLGVFDGMQFIYFQF